MRLLISLLALLVLAAIVALFLLRQGHLSWNADTAAARASLEAGTREAAVKTYSRSELAGLPVPVARYLGLVLREGQPMVTRARITWNGEFNMGEPDKDNWKPMEASQDYRVEPAGFVWDARIAMAPGLPALVRDSFLDGQGAMLGKAAGLWTVVDKAGTPEIAAGALQRHLGEAIWFPTALLPGQGVGWTAVDDRRALATLSAGGVSASVEFHFGADGLVTLARVPSRLYDNGRDPPAMHPWQARITGWRDAAGMKVPASAVAEWLLPTGTYAYWRGSATTIEYQTITGQ